MGKVMTSKIIRLVLIVCAALVGVMIAFVLLTPAKPKIRPGTYQRVDSYKDGQKIYDVHEKEYVETIKIIDKKNCEVKGYQATYKIQKDKHGWYIAISYKTTTMGNTIPKGLKYYCMVEDGDLKLRVNPSWKVWKTYERQ